MAKEPITTRLDSDTKTEVENYADDRDIGQTEASRRLIRAGLAAEGHPVTATDGGAQDSPTQDIAESVSATGTFTLLVGGLAGIINVLGISLTPYDIAGALYALGLVALPVTLSALTVAYSGVDERIGGWVGQ